MIVGPDGSQFNHVLKMAFSSIRMSAMGEIRSILKRLPLRELEIRRLCALDTGFGSICADYEEASEALCYWQTVDEKGTRQPDIQVIGEYRELLGELEAEILTRLDQALTNLRRS